VDLLEREAFLERLGSLLDEVRSGEGRLALVTGEAGIGKTALIGTFCQRFADRGRTMWGNCDSITPRRPFAPLIDFASSCPPLADAITTAERDRILDTFLAWIAEAPPRVIVFEDLHWADEATLDLLRVLAPRLGRLPHLIIGSFRPYEVGELDPLNRALDRFPSAITTQLALPPLSPEAVATLTAGTCHDPNRIHALTGGNPLFVIELTSHDTENPPPNVIRAVQRRMEHLSSAARSTIEAASILSDRFTTQLLVAVTEDASAVDECVAKGMLTLDHGALGFRHELSRQAVASSLPLDLRTEWHRRALRALEADPTADPAHLAQHAVGAGDPEATMRWTTEAAIRADQLGAHRQAAEHRIVALQTDALDDRQRAELLEDHARAAVAADDLVPALESQQAATRLWVRTGDTVRQANSLSANSQILWLSGEGIAAIEAAEEAVALLEVSAPGSEHLAMAYAVAAQRHMVAAADEQAIRFARMALDLGEKLGREDVIIHAGITIGTTEIYTGDEGGWTRLEDCAARAAALGMRREATRALINLVEAAKDDYRLRAATRYTETARASLSPYDLGLYPHLLGLRYAEILLEMGDWDQADERCAALALDRTVSEIVRARALIVQGRLRARRGTGNAWQPLDTAATMIGGTEIQDLRILYTARAEAAWLAGDTTRALVEAEIGLDACHGGSSRSSWRAELAFWAWKSGSQQNVPEFGPFRLHAEGRPAQAAAAWDEIGCPYFRGVALADSQSDEDLELALHIFVELGARPWERIVGAEMRRRGVRRVRRGPRPATRTNPAGLTNRQLEVAELLAERLTNREIAERLVISPKTVDHHVSAVLTKLGIGSRREARTALSSDER
jgi:DNA-binding CsgD family transcriptional regulator